MPEKSSAHRVVCLFLTLKSDVFSSSRYVAIYPYTPRKEDELELRKGEMFLVFERCQDGSFISELVTQNFRVHKNHLENLLNRFFGSTYRCSLGLWWGPDFAFLTNCQGMLMLLVHRPHLAWHCCRPCCLYILI